MPNSAQATTESITNSDTYSKIISLKNHNQTFSFQNFISLSLKKKKVLILGESLTVYILVPYDYPLTTSPCLFLQKNHLHSKTDLFCMYVFLPAWVHMYHMCAGASRGQKRVLDSLELNLAADEPPFPCWDRRAGHALTTSPPPPFCTLHSTQSSLTALHLERSATCTVLHLSFQDNNACSLASCEGAGKMAAPSALTGLYTVTR